jgi:hypothetical protein
LAWAPWPITYLADPRLDLFCFLEVQLPPQAYFDPQPCAQPHTDTLETTEPYTTRQLSHHAVHPTLPSSQFPCHAPTLASCARAPGVGIPHVFGCFPPHAFGVVSVTFANVVETPDASDIGWSRTFVRRWTSPSQSGISPTVGFDPRTLSLQDRPLTTLGNERSHD